MDSTQAPGGDQLQGWLQDDPQPAPAEYRKLMLTNLPEYRGPRKQSWNSHIPHLAAYRVPLDWLLGKSVLPLRRPTKEDTQLSRAQPGA